jgi:ABC-type multidrug transport system fused ATPase/permease subunit
MSKPDVCLEGVSFSYPEGEPLFNQIDLDVYPGELVCMVGPNGGGSPPC